MSIATLRSALSSALVERHNEIEALLLGIISRQHVLLVGPPGTGKSYLCRSVADGIDAANYTERLLAPTTPPEALFGPVDIAALRDGRYEHVGSGTAQDAHILFLDEVFRANAAILDSLLHLLGPERQALIGTKQVKVPLVCAIGATNTWSDSADQQAIFDRWLLRVQVRPVTPSGREQVMFDDLPPVTPELTLSELEELQEKARTLGLAQQTREALSEILHELNSEGISPSDRRCRGAVGIARARAMLDGADEVKPEHLEPLQWVLWDQPGEQAEKATATILKVACPGVAEINSLLLEVEELVTEAGTRPQTIIPQIAKLEEVATKTRRLKDAGGARAAAAHEHVMKTKLRLSAMAMGVSERAASERLGGSR